QRGHQCAGFGQQDVGSLDELGRQRGVQQSDEVMPKWTHAAASRGSVLSAHAVRNAMTSCWVTASISDTRSGVGGGAVRTGSTASAGTVPAAAWASRTRV